MNKIKYPSRIVFLLLTSQLLCFEAWGVATDLTGTIGNLCEYVGKIQTDESGSTNKCSFNPYFATSLDIPLTPSFLFSPRIGATLPKSGRDENIKRMTFQFLANTKYKTSYVDLIGGVGLFITRIWGPGGEATLNNGNGTDSFPLPKEAVYARNLVLNLGLGINFNQEWTGELHTYVFNTLESEDRAFSIGFNATYHFGEVL